MKNFLLTMLAVGCAVVLFLGNMHWKEETAVSVEDVESSNGGAQAAESGAPVEQETKSNADAEAILELAKNWPEDARLRLEERIAEGVSYKIAFVGSNALDSWAPLSKAAIEEAYGEEVVSVTLQGFDGTTADYTNENKAAELADLNADLVLLEPFTLADNGVIRIEDSLLHISNWIDAVQAENSDTVFMLQPSQPIHLAGYYLTQLDALEQFANEREIVYMDHWTAWPGTQEDALLGYLTDENLPNEEGARVWSEFVNGVFVGE
ncbi:SGNH/GDSL hydrolase family protein [Cytobacillus gottheilii]|uniref:SGNH/GDSL hydrolase family protein n=1 Tax=Cytobacillus gottheilii TaxID=859144 RepID=UPI000835BA4B|nr:SGNH/GDSL hydrolase family protein [Cytobacillus gottheilii]